MASLKQTRITEAQALEFVYRFEFVVAVDGELEVFRIKSFDEKMVARYKWRNVAEFINQKIKPLYHICNALDAKAIPKNLSLRLQDLSDELSLNTKKIELNEFQIETLNELFGLFANKDISSIKALIKDWETFKYDDVRLFVYAYAYGLSIPFDLKYKGDFSKLFANTFEFYQKSKKIKVLDVVNLLKEERKIQYSGRHIRDICRELKLKTTQDVGRPAS